MASKAKVKAAPKIGHDPVALGVRDGTNIATTVQGASDSAMEILRAAFLLLMPQGSATLVQYVATVKAHLGKALGIMSIRVYVANFSRLALGTADATVAEAAVKLLESGQAINSANMTAAKIPTVSTRGRPSAPAAGNAPSDPVALIVATFKGLTAVQRVATVKAIFAEVVSKLADPRARVAATEVIEAYAKAA